MVVDIESLASRLRLIEDRREILSSLYQYGHALDSGNETQFLDCFTPTGSWVSNGAKRRFRGTNGLLGFFRNHTHSPEYEHKHVILNPLVEIDGDTATVKSVYIRFDEHPEGPYVSSFGRYADTLKRCPDGRWRIEERLVDGDARAGRDFPPRPAWTTNFEVGEPL